MGFYFYNLLAILQWIDLVWGVMEPVDGFVKVPDRPGLGVELDRSALEKYRIG